MADFLPLYLAQLKEGITAGSIGAEKISDTRRRMKLMLTWEEDNFPERAAEIRAVSGSETTLVEKTEEKEVLPADLMTLVQRTNGIWTPVLTNQMIPTRIIVFKLINGKAEKCEFWSEASANSKLADIVTEITEEIYSCQMRVFLCPVAKSAPLIPLTGEMLTKSVKEVDLHRGKLCIVVDTANLI